MAKIIGILIANVALSTLCFGQATKNRDTTGQKVQEKFYLTDKRPDFPRGMEKFYKYVSKNMQYPEDAKSQGIEGKVFVSFVVDTTGLIRPNEVEVIKGISASCNQEAMRLVKGRPQWTPGYSTKLEKKVPTKMILPIVFSL